MSEEKHTVCVQLSEATWQTLKDIADKEGTSIADVLRNIIDIYIFIVKAAPMSIFLQQIVDVLGKL